MTVGNWTQPVAGTSDPEFPAGAQAAAKAINAAGGIHGRMLDVIVCSDELNTNVARNCANQAISQKVTAIVGLQTFNSAVMFPILQRAGIPAVGVVPFTEADLTARDAFVDNGGTVVNWGGGAVALKQLGVHKVSVIGPAGLTTALSLSTLQSALHALGMSYAGITQIPQNTSDLSAVIASATKNGVDGIFGYAFDEASMISALKQDAPNVKLVTTPFNLSPEVMKSLGSAANGVMVAPETVMPDSSAPGAVAFRRDLSAFNSTLIPTQIGLHEWIAVETFAKVAEGLSTISPATVLAAYEKIRGLDMQGVTPPYSTALRTGHGPQFARLFNQTSSPVTVKDGKFVPVNPSGPTFVQSFFGG
jgi:ABC-type branched-subunit amino acid transport system substrate-binding protein